MPPTGQLSPAERHRLLVEWNSTAADYAHDACVHSLVEARAVRTPSAVVLLCGDRRLTYSELNARANQLAHYLRKRGVGPDVLVGICVERSAEMVVAVLAVLKAGGAYVPLDPAYPKERIAFILENASAAVLLTQENLRATLPQVSGEVVSLDTDWHLIARESDANPASPSTPRHLAYVIYTSGSTGKPKGVQIEHRSVVNFLAAMQRKPGLRQNDILLAVTTLSFDIAGLELYLPLVTGAQLVLASREDCVDGQRLMRLMEQSGITVMQATPATWRLLLESGWKGNPKLKVLCGGEALPRDLAEQLVPRCSELWNMYGPTETTIWSTVYQVRDVKWTTAPIGRPIANTQAYILDSGLEPVAVGIEGELWLAGDGLSRGYHGRPDLTAERFLPNPFASDATAQMYRTGDLARYLPDGSIEYLGRVDDQVKIRGFRIELGEIESVLTQHPGVSAAVVVAREDKPGDKRLVAYLVPSPKQSVSVSELRAYLQQRLPDYMVPSAVVKLERFPLTPNGKVDRRSLPAPEISDFESQDHFVNPKDEVERRLVSICEEVLGIRRIGATTNLFELGAHSLQVARVFMKISRAFNRDLPLALLFEAPTPAQLAVFLRTGAAEMFPTLVAVQPRGSQIPLFCVHGGAGTTLYLRKLSQYLGPDQPVYGLESEGLDGRRISRNRVEQMAAHYLSEIRKVQAQGPYFLGGYCFGGVVAFEMARQLVQQGQTVALLALLNAPLRFNQTGQQAITAPTNQKRLTGIRRLRAAVRWRIKRLRTKLRLAFDATTFGLFPALGIPVPQSMRTRYVLWMTDRAEAMYQPKTYSGSLQLFRGKGLYDADPEMGWSGLAGEGLEIYEIGQGAQAARQEIVNEPVVAELAQKLGSCLLRNRDVVSGDQRPTAEISSDLSNHVVRTVSQPQVTSTLQN